MPNRRRALLLVALLGLWLLGQGAHDLLAHAGEWGHGPAGDHSTCSLFQGLHQIAWTGLDLPTPEGRCPEAPLASAIPAAPGPRPQGIASRAPPPTA